jgi:putative SOS response-associated peptidase YedK
MYLAALTSIQRDEDAAEPGAGFVIVTSVADEGLVDVHDRRPLVFAPATAKRWLDVQASNEDIGELVRTDGVPASHFVWHRVTSDVNRATNDEPRLIEPLAEIP